MIWTPPRKRLWTPRDRRGFLAFTLAESGCVCCGLNPCGCEPCLDHQYPEQLEVATADLSDDVCDAGECAELERSWILDWSGSCSCQNAFNSYTFGSLGNEAIHLTTYFADFSDVTFSCAADTLEGIIRVTAWIYWYPVIEARGVSITLHVLDSPQQLIVIWRKIEDPATEPYTCTDLSGFAVDTDVRSGINVPGTMYCDVLAPATATVTAA